MTVVSPGDNTLTGCLAIAGLDDVYTDFIAEFDADHEDNDVSFCL